MQNLVEHLYALCGNDLGRATALLEKYRECKATSVMTLIEILRSISCDLFFRWIDKSFGMILSGITIRFYLTTAERIV